MKEGRIGTSGDILLKCNMNIGASNPADDIYSVQIFAEDPVSIPALADLSTNTTF